MGVVVEYPITVHHDNIEALLVSENTSVSRWTKQIDVRHNLIWEYIECVFWSPDFRYIFPLWGGGVPTPGGYLLQS